MAENMYIFFCKIIIVKVEKRKKKKRLGGGWRRSSMVADGGRWWELTVVVADYDNMCSDSSDSRCKWSVVWCSNVKNVV